jgi:hypothetical protein
MYSILEAPNVPSYFSRIHSCSKNRCEPWKLAIQQTVSLYHLQTDVMTSLIYLYIRKYSTMQLIDVLNGWCHGLSGAAL